MKWPCIFRGAIVRDHVDPRLAADYEGVPFGDFRRTWREQHCRAINPYGSDGCPYSERECAAAFEDVAREAMYARVPGAYFRVRARTTGLDRAENKPLAREAERPRHGRDGGRSHAPRHDDDLPLVDGAGAHRDPDHRPDEEEAALRRAAARPRRIGELFGTLDT